MTDKKDITVEIKNTLAILGTKDTGWTKEVNIVSWNGSQDKVDVREWSPDHKLCGKGITLTRDETEIMFKALNVFLNPADDDLPFND